MKIFVACSASDDIAEEIKTDCRELLEMVLKENDLVFGAFSRGLMGISYDVAKQYHRNIIGICPEVFKADFEELDCDQEITTPLMGDRIEALINESNAILFLPGGLGTFAELFLAIEKKRNHEMDMPIIIYNCNHFYDNLLRTLDALYQGGFTPKKDAAAYVVTSSKEEVVSILENKKGK